MDSFSSSIIVALLDIGYRCNGQGRCHSHFFISWRHRDVISISSRQWRHRDVIISSSSWSRRSPAGAGSSNASRHLHDLQQEHSTTINIVHVFPKLQEDGWINEWIWLAQNEQLYKIFHIIYFIYTVWSRPILNNNFFLLKSQTLH